MCVNWNQKIEQKKQKNCDRANKKINNRKGCLDTNKQSDRAEKGLMISVRETWNDCLSPG